MVFGRVKAEVEGFDSREGLTTSRHRARLKWFKSVTGMQRAVIGPANGYKSDHMYRFQFRNAIITHSYGRTPRAFLQVSAFQGDNNYKLITIQFSEPF